MAAGFGATGATGAGRMALLPVFTMYTLWNVENAILGDVVWTEGDGGEPHAVQCAGGELRQLQRGGD